MCTGMIQSRVHSFKPIPFSVAFFLRNVYSFTHFSENGRFGRSPEPSSPKPRTFSRLLRGVRLLSKLAVLPRGSRIFRIHILLKFEILFLKAYRFQNSEGLERLKEYSPNRNLSSLFLPALIPLTWQLHHIQKPKCIHFHLKHTVHFLNPTAHGILSFVSHTSENKVLD